MLERVELIEKIDCRIESSRRMEMLLERESFTDWKIKNDKNSLRESTDCYGMNFRLTIELVSRLNWILNYRKLD